MGFSRFPRFPRFWSRTVRTGFLKNGPTLPSVWVSESWFPLVFSGCSSWTTSGNWDAGVLMLHLCPFIEPSVSQVHLPRLCDPPSYPSVEQDRWRRKIPQPRSGERAPYFLPLFPPFFLPPTEQIFWRVSTIARNFFFLEICGGLSSILWITFSNAGFMF